MIVISPKKCVAKSYICIHTPLHIHSHIYVNIYLKYTHTKKRDSLKITKQLNTEVPNPYTGIDNFSTLLDLLRLGYKVREKDY